MDEIERAAMSMLLDGDHPVLETLREQVQAAGVRDRQMTGVGFFTDFSVPAECPRLAKRSQFVIGDVYAEISGLKHAAGFLLFVENGKVSFLECFTVDDVWPDSAEVLRAYYVRRKFDGSVELVETAERDLSTALRDAV